MRKGLKVSHRKTRWSKTEAPPPGRVKQMDKRDERVPPPPRKASR